MEARVAEDGLMLKHCPGADGKCLFLSIIHQCQLHEVSCEQDPDELRAALCDILADQALLLRPWTDDPSDPSRNELHHLIKSVADTAGFDTVEEYVHEMRKDKCYGDEGPILAACIHLHVQIKCYNLRCFEQWRQESGFELFRVPRMFRPGYESCPTITVALVGQHYYSTIPLGIHLRDVTALLSEHYDLGVVQSSFQSVDSSFVSQEARSRVLEELRTALISPEQRDANMKRYQKTCNAEVVSVSPDGSCGVSCWSP